MTPEQIRELRARLNDQRHAAIVHMPRCIYEELVDLAERATTARAEAIRDGHKQAREWVDKFDIPKARAEAIRECAKICAERAKLWEREAAKIERLTGKWVDLKALSEDSRINEDAILALLEKPHVPAK